MTENGSQIGVGSWQRVAIFDAETMAPSPLLAFETISKNVTAVGFQVTRNTCNAIQMNVYLE